MHNLVIYEHPLNERMRTFLRLEQLFKELGYFLPQTEEWGSRAAIDSLLKILVIFGRTDIKTELTKELERQAQKLVRMKNQPGVDPNALTEILDHLDRETTKISHIEGLFGQHLRNNEFLKAILQRSAIPGGTCSFDLPQYHYWLQQPAAQRLQQMQAWLQKIHPLRDAISLLLDLIRRSSRPKQEVAVQGFFQQSLDSQVPAQLIRVGVDSEAAVFAEISGSKHRFSVRFLEPTEIERPMQTQKDITFSLNCCVI